MSYWLFQANPARYDVIEDLARGGPSTWNIGHRRAEIAVGDGVLIWLSGERGGVYATGHVVREPAQQQDLHPELWSDGSGRAEDVWRCLVQYDRVLEHPVAKAELAGDEAFANAEILLQPRSRNPFRVNDQEWEAIARRIGSSSEEAADFARATDTSTGDSLEPGRTYSWDRLGDSFGFKPAYLTVAGGMPVSAATDSVLLITHPRGGKSFDYEDYWDGADLIYTGRGKAGPQKRTGANLDVAENRRRLHAFEAAGPRRLLYLGEPVCVEERRGRAPGDDGHMRSVLQFRLRFPDGHGRSHATEVSEGDKGVGNQEEALRERRPRPFDPARMPAVPSLPATALEPEEIKTKQEKASRGHHSLIARLSALLSKAGWTEIEEIPAAIDLRGIAPGGQRVILEGKTISETNEISQCRGGLAQLLEYRIEHGHPDDQLCLVVDAEISIRRARILDSLGVGLVVVPADGWWPGNDRGSAVIKG